MPFHTKNITCAAALLLIFLVTATAQNGSTAQIDEFVKAEMQRQHLPGVSLAIVKDGTLVYAKGYGYSNVEHQVPVKPETIFQSGSVGKQFTATAVMMLVEEGKVSLDEKISKYLGEVPQAWQNITVRHLLTHTSGLTDYPDDFDFRRDYTEDELLKTRTSDPTRFQTRREMAVQQSRLSHAWDSYSQSHRRVLR
jgi:CubicO group peptidase (beta-lactamase class C family)